MKKISIIGGGLSGLTLAYVLLSKNKDLDLAVIESESRPGGKVWSDRSDGFLCEKGPNGFLDSKPKTLELCSSLGIDPVRSNENSKKRFIFMNNRLNALPESPPAFLKSDIISWSGKIRMLYELIASKGPEDETVSDFIIRRLGKEALDTLIDPMASGIYAGDPYNMSIKSCFPRIKELELEYGSLIRAMIKIQKQKKRERKKSGDSKVSVAPGGTLTSFMNGTQTLTDALADRIGDSLKLGVSVNSMSKKDTSYVLHTSDGDKDADIVVLASPAYAASEILMDLDAEIAGILTDIPYPHVAVVCFGYRKDKITRSLNGFGFLIPHKERKKILGTLWDSSVFPNRASEGHALLRSMIGGAKHPEIGDMDDDKVVSIVFDELRPIMGLKSDPDMVRIYRWEKAIPQYLLGHPEKLDLIDKKLRAHPGLHLTGNAYRGIGMNDCVANSYELADEILQSVK
ncbi:MAG: protoporphyrinogen oxidase [Nitrospiraceae bacterium]|nr:MAG: protoporphyrinogen oxidase [Nitrospiraceae bacterium]